MAQSYQPRLIPTASTSSSVINTPPIGDHSQTTMDYSEQNHNTTSSHGSHTTSQPNSAPLDMDIMHDFGEGVGVDMRDFPGHTETEGDETVGLVDHDEMKQSVSHITPNLMSAPYAPEGVTSNGKHDGLSSASVNIDDMFKAETGLEGDDDDDDGDDLAMPSGKRSRPNMDVPGGFTYVDKDGGESGRRKIRIEYIADKSRRHITFSKRKAGIMKKAYELSILTGTQILLLVVSETGLVYTFTTTKLQPLVQKPEGKNLIQACLNAPEGFGPDGQPISGPVPTTKAKNGGLAIRPHKLTPSASAALAASAQAASAAHGQAEHDQQGDAAAAVGQGTPVGRPKKRLPSGKGKKAQAAAAAEMAAQQGNGQHGDMVPPVPSIPEIHRQASPHSAPGTIMPGSLASPMSGGYHIPPEYHHQSPTNPTFGYPHGPGDYQGGYYAPPPGQGHPHHQYLNVQGHPGHLYSPDGRDRRMMVDSQGRSMGMGM